MTLRVGKLVYGMIRLLPCLLAVLLASSCSSDVNSDEQKGDKTLVTLTIAASGNAATASRAISGNSSTITRGGVSDSNDKDYYISDLTVLIFDESGNVIGSTTKQASDLSIADGKITIQVLTRAAQNCTVYAIANALALNGDKTPFAGIATLSALKSKVKTYTNADDINTETCLLMMGKTADNSFDTTNSGSAAAISLQRLASKITFNIKAEANDIKGISYPVVIDSYQLCNVPNATFYTHDDMANPTLPADNTYQNFSEQKTPVNSWDSNPIVSYVQYVYANPATAETNATYLLIKAHAQASSANTAKIWESVFKVYLKEVKQGGALMTQYQILPNYHYTVNITIKGSKVTTDNGVQCTAYPFFSTGSLQKWTPDTTDIDFKYEGN